MITTARSIKDIWTHRPPHPKWPLKSPSAGLEARIVLTPYVTIGVVIVWGPSSVLPVEAEGLLKLTWQVDGKSMEVISLGEFLN